LVSLFPFSARLGEPGGMVAGYVFRLSSKPDELPVSIDRSEMGLDFALVRNPHAVFQ